MKDIFTERELVDLEYFIKDMGIKTGADSHSFGVTNGCATYYLHLDEFEQRTCLFKPSYFGRNPKGNWIAVDFVIGKNGNCVLGGVRNIDPSVAKNSSNYRDFDKGYVGKYWKFDVPHDFFDYMNESKKSARKSIKESRKSILDERFYELVDEGYIYDEDEDGMNMSYGEFVAVSDDLWETLEDELKYYDDFQEAYDVYMDIMDNTGDDAKMFMTGSDEYFYFEADEDEGTYSVDGEVPFVLEKLFKQFQKNTDLVRR